MQRLKLPNYNIEKSYKNLLVAGIDEAGRGPLAGPVVAACVFLDEEFLRDKICDKINDSKKLSATKRKEIFLHLKQMVKFGVGVVDEKIIDEINILQATKLAMFRAYEDFYKCHKILPQVLLVDGNFKPFALQDDLQEILPIVQGDQKSLSIAAASIIAKEVRDEIMLRLHQKYPQFGWDKNAGYPTKFHVDMILNFGICEFHRKSFGPVRKAVQSALKIN